MVIWYLVFMKPIVRSRHIRGLQLALDEFTPDGIAWAPLCLESVAQTSFSLEERFTTASAAWLWVTLRAYSPIAGTSREAQSVTTLTFSRLLTFTHLMFL